MGDMKGPEFGWSRIAPTKRGWFEIADIDDIDKPMPKAVRAWHDGSGGLFAPVEVPRRGRIAMGIPASMVIATARMGELSKEIVMLPIRGAMHGACYRALWPLLKDPDPKFLPDEAKVPPFQRPENYLTRDQLFELRGRSQV